ncbi:MAG: PKD domain-containing protein [Planctomycetaceae bacterium]
MTITANITDAGVDTFSIVWDMGDSTTFNDVTEVTHTYAAGGKFFASLTVTDSDGRQPKTSAWSSLHPSRPTASQTVLEEAAIIPVGTEHQVNDHTQQPNDGIYHTFECGCRWEWRLRHHLGQW